MIINLISLSVCSDNDLIIGKDPIKESDINLFIKYHNIIDYNLISDIKSIINNNFNSIPTHQSIINFRQIDNKIYSIGIQLENKIRYINSLKPDIIDDYISNKLRYIASSIINSNVDFILLQDIYQYYMCELAIHLNTYQIISPYEINQLYDNIYVGSIGNYILYRESIEIKLIDTELRDYGTVGIFNIIDKNVEIISGSWPLINTDKIYRMQNLKQLDNDSINKNIIFIGNTNFSNNVIVPTINIKDAIIANDFNIYYTVDKYVNKYYPTDTACVNRNDRIYINNVELIDYRLIFNTYYIELINEYRYSGYVSDHFGYSVKIYI